MLLDLSDEQSLLQTSLDRIADRYGELPIDHGAYVHYGSDLQRELAEGGFLGIAGHEGYGALDAALLVERIARLPYSVEVAASSLIGPALGRELKGPLALCESLGRPTRYLPQASDVCVLADEKIYVAELQPNDVQAIDSVMAYPLGVLTEMPAGATPLDNETAASVRTLWRIALAAETAGLMRGALDLTVKYVMERQQFGQPLGNFQALQHRLAICEQIVSGTYLLAMRAADSLEPMHAATAALYAQEHVRTIIYDCHQLHGAMGLTLEYPLHLWTYRLKFIQGELGGRSAQAAALAELRWP